MLKDKMKVSLSEDRVLTIRTKILTESEAPLSNTGRSKILYTTSGFQYISVNGEKIGISLNVIPSKR